MSRCDVVADRPSWRPPASRRRPPKTSLPPIARVFVVLPSEHQCCGCHVSHSHRTDRGGQRERGSEGEAHAFRTHRADGAGENACGTTSGTGPTASAIPGNAGAHGEKFDPVTIDQATELQTFIREMLNFLYEQPARRAAARPATKKANRPACGGSTPAGASGTPPGSGQA